jgi:DNA-binding NtrC family response regulator
MRILIANNTTFITNGLLEMVSKIDDKIEMILFDSPRQAVKILDSDSAIDIIISSPIEIEDSKVNLLRHVRKSARLSWIPMIVASDSFGDNAIQTFILNGATDIIVLPINKDALNARIQTAMNKGRRKVLVVDDNEDLLEVLKTFLEMERYTVITSLTAEQGEAAIDNNKVDAVISDIMLPEMSGVDFMIKVKSKFQTMPVILITGYFERYTPQQILDAGASAFFIKPFNNRELAITLRRLLETS